MGLSSLSCGLWSRHPSHLFYYVPQQCQFNCQCDNFEPKEVRLIKLLSMVRSRGWKKLLSSIPRRSANKVSICNVVRFVHISSVSITVLYYGQFHSFTMLIAEITLQWWRMHVHQYADILCVLPHYCCQVISHLSLCHPSSVPWYIQNSSASLFYLI